ncbi:MAG: glycosyltransferase family 39 protein [Acidimicrobiales bacterium]
MTAHRTRPASLSPFAWAPVGAISAAGIVFHLATASLYGLHRDEYYYLAAGRHLAWGYVDQPPVTPMLYRLAESVFGTSMLGLHVFPALIGALTVFLAVLLAREMGGGPVAQTMTATVAATAPLFVATSRFLSTVTVDIAVWCAATLLVVRILRSANVRLWIAVGAVVGLGLMNKATVVVWVLAMGAGIVLSPSRRLLWSGWLFAGGLVALTLVAPNLAWQASHHWASVEFAGALRHRTGAENLALFVPFQLVLPTAAGVVLWFVGLRWMVRSPDGAVYAPIGIAFVVVIVVCFVSEGKAYYVGSMYLPIIAAGTVAVESSWPHARRQRLTVVAVGLAALTLPFVTPVFPERALRVVAVQSVNHDLGAMLGWRRVAQRLGEVEASLPSASRPHAVILTATYSEAGVVDYWRSTYHLGPAISGHNGYWWWGWGPAGDGPIVTDGLSPALLRTLFADVHVVGAMGGHGALLDSEEQGAPIAVCSHPLLPWSQLWPRIRRYA